MSFGLSPLPSVPTHLVASTSTLICFHSMIKTLDKFTLTEKLVPLLAKIKTKEPAVMIATLAYVRSSRSALFTPLTSYAGPQSTRSDGQQGRDRVEWVLSWSSCRTPLTSHLPSVATLILPQLWAMSMGPLLNASQFAKASPLLGSLSVTS